MRSLTRTEGVDILIELEPHYCPIVVNDVGLTIPGARYHLLSAVSLEANRHILTMIIKISGTCL